MSVQLTPGSWRSWSTKTGNFSAATLPVTPTRTRKLPEEFSESTVWQKTCLSCCMLAKHEASVPSRAGCHLFSYQPMVLSYTSPNIQSERRTSPERVRRLNGRFESAHAKRNILGISLKACRAASARLCDFIWNRFENNNDANASRLLGSAARGHLPASGAYGCSGEWNLTSGDITVGSAL